MLWCLATLARHQYPWQHKPLPPAVLQSAVYVHRDIERQKSVGAVFGATASPGQPSGGAVRSISAMVSRPACNCQR